MNVLVTGASGFVGVALCKALHDNNISISAVVRNPSLEIKHAKLFIKELNEHTEWHDVLKDIDVIVHLAGRAHVMKEQASDPYSAYASINIGATKHLAEQAVASNVKRFIFLSSIKANGEETDGTAFVEASIPNPKDDYAKTKYEAEQLLKKTAADTSMEMVIIRPPLIYGKGVKANFKNLIRLSQLNMPLPFGSIYNKRSMVYIENLIDFIMLCVKHPKAANETFLVSDDEDVSTTRLISSMREASEMKTMLIPVPQKMLVFIFKILGKSTLATRLCGNLQVDITKAKTLLGWKPPYSIQQGITKTVVGEV